MTETAISPEAIRAQLARILAGDEFRASPRLSAFLRYVVEETLAGREAEIKGYSIAVSVFERPPSFDPNADPIVRVEATRLRRALAQYYLTAGRGDPVQIVLPKGGYVPLFRDHVPEAAPEMPGPAPDVPQRFSLADIAQRMPGRILAAALGLVLLAVGLGWIAGRLTPPLEPPSIAVLPFANLTGSASNDMLTRGLTIELANELARDRSLRVFTGDPVALAAMPAAADALSQRAIYLLTGSVRLAGEMARIEARLSDRATGETLWSSVYERRITAPDLLAIELALARDIATVVTQPYGILSRLEEARAPESVGARSLSAYLCVLQAHAYWRELEPSAHARTRACLERAIRDEPRNAAAHAALTFLYLDEYRYGFNVRGTYDPLDRALQSARMAVSLDPYDAEAHQALYGAYLYREDLLNFRRSGARALELNPNNTEIRADYGAKLAMRLDRTAGLTLLRSAMEDMLVCSGWCHIPLLLDSYTRGDYELALAHADELQMPRYFRTYVFRAMIHGQMGNQAAAQAALQELDRLKPDFRINAAIYLTRWGLSLEIMRAMAEGLTKAGLEVTL